MSSVTKCGFSAPVSTVGEFRERYQGVAEDVTRISSLDSTVDIINGNKKETKELFLQLKEKSSELNDLMISLGYLLRYDLDPITVIEDPYLKTFSPTELMNRSIDKKECRDLLAQIDKVGAVIKGIYGKIDEKSVGNDEKLKCIKEVADDCKGRLEKIDLLTIESDLMAVNDLSQLTEQDQEMVRTISMLSSSGGVQGFLSSHHSSLQIKQKKQIRFSDGFGKQPKSLSDYQDVVRLCQGPQENTDSWNKRQLYANLNATLFSALHKQNMDLPEVEQSYLNIAYEIATGCNIL